MLPIVQDLKVSVVYGSLLLIFVSECVQITVDILQLFRTFRSASYCYQVLTNMFEAFINLQDASKNDHLQGRAPMCQFWVRF